jgi:cardiolipin synthase
VFEIAFPGNHSLDLIWLADVSAAAAVTCHVLLKRSDVRAAAGWIGLAWLSPFIGSGLYFVLGINRIARRGIRMSRAVNQEGNEQQGAEGGFGADLLAGNRVWLLRDGAQTYAQMISAIDGARSSVALSSYIFRADEVGLGFIEALERAKSRGVLTRVLVDGIGSGYFHSGAMIHLRNRGITAARFLHSWLPWRASLLNLRNHKKLLIVDGAIGVTGGRNIGAENLASSPAQTLVNDVHFRIEGPVVRDLLRSFACDWTFTTGETLGGAQWWPELTRVGSVRARGISSGPDEDIENLVLVLASAIGRARERIRIVTPYFLPDEMLSLLISVARKRGVRLEIIVPERSDHLIAQWAVFCQLGFMVPGCQIYLSREPFDHSKLVTIDGAWVLVGSANWDVRSLRLNFEFNVECVDEQLTAQLDGFIDETIARSRLYEDMRPTVVKLRDAAARLFLPYL